MTRSSDEDRGGRTGAVRAERARQLRRELTILLTRRRTKVEGEHCSPLPGRRARVAESTSLQARPVSERSRHGSTRHRDSPVSQAGSDADERHQVPLSTVRSAGELCRVESERSSGEVGIKGLTKSRGVWCSRALYNHVDESGNDTVSPVIA